MTVYPTIKAAINQISLDYGANPFIVNRWGRPTKAKLQELGYVVDAKEYRKQREEKERWKKKGLCRVCGKTSIKWFCNSHGILDCSSCGPVGFCKEHMKWGHVCDNMHRWSCTDEEDKNNEHRCPTCGEYWV